MIKAAFFDLDGTLFSHRTNTIAPSARQALEALRRRGILVFLATGRHRSILEGLPQLRDVHYDGAVTLNGSYCYSRDALIYHNPICPGDIASLLDQLQQQPMPCGFIEADRAYINYHNDRVQQVHDAIHTPLLPIGNLDRGYTHPIYQVLLYLTETERDFIPPMPHCRFTRWNTGGIDVIPSSGGKDIGIQKVLAHYGLSREETIAFGDGDNDIDMFRAVHIAVAMGNSNDRVKAAAHYVTADVDEDGIYTGLKHFGLI
ncbi:MAG: Cof-type HAD-IIB family hydrolase [Oscillospiraceae bacterium]|nr:Cof-type HAD-IIB family hydrolase [Oscillospiraceae bacterium]